MSLKHPKIYAIETTGRQPWPMLLAAIVSLAAVYFTGGQSFGMIILAALIAVSGFTDWRLPRGIIISWLVRIVLFTVVLTATGPLPSHRDVSTWYLDPAVMRLAGFLLSAELTLRVWQRRFAPRLAREVFLLTACIMATAAVTYDSAPIHILAPVYALALILSLRSFPTEAQSASILFRFKMSANGLRALALASAIGIGFTCVTVYEKFATQMDLWAASLLQYQPSRERNSIGFSTSNTLEGAFEPYPSMDRVLLIDGKLNDPHLRILAFDEYMNRSWLPGTNVRKFQAFNPPPVASTSDRLVKFTQLETTYDFLSLPLNTQSVDCEQALEADNLGTLRQSTDETMPYSVALAKSPDFQGPLCVAPDDAERKKLLFVPAALDQTVSPLAKRVAGDGDPKTRVIRLQEYLRSHHSYSLSYHPAAGQEPLVDFILNNRAAHCQYFASALVMMARAAGVPARYVTGFYAHESYGSDGMVVRDRDAHAWAECWIDGTGWMTFDATPSDGLPDEIYADATGWRNFWESVLDLPRMLRQWLADALGHAGMTMGIVAAALLLIIVALKAIRSRKPAAAVLTYSQPDAAVIELARRFEIWLAARKIRCPPNRTWNECLSEFDPHNSSRQFINLYSEARFGNNSQAADDAAGILIKLETQKGNTADARSS